MKNFDIWNERKKETDNGDVWRVFYEREVWWCTTGINIGVEIDGKHELFLRPVIVLRKFNKDMALVIPTTTQDKSNSYYLMVYSEKGKSYNACLSHIKTISTKRLHRKIGMIDVCSYIELIKSVVLMIQKSIL